MIVGPPRSTLFPDTTRVRAQWHHRGVPPFESARASDMVRTFGPSVATGSRAFHERYGTDDELLEYQEQLLAGARAFIEEAKV